MLKIKNVLVLILSVFFLHFAPQEQDEFTSELTKKFQRYHQLFPREKAYVQLSKTVFKPKELLWFKAYIVESLQHKPSDLSEDLTIKLIDETGRVVFKDRYSIKNGFAQGNFKIPKSMKEGIYTLAGYSNWMQNGSEEDVFHQQISIVNSFLPKFFIYVDLNDSLYMKKDSMSAAIHVWTRKKQPIKNLVMDYEIQMTDEILKKGKQKTDENGIARVQFILPQQSVDRFTLLKLKAKYKKNVETRAILIPTQQTKINMTFFPEGGSLVDGIHTKVAFQAVDELMNPMDISGVVVNQKQDVITKLKTNDNGIGLFSLNPSIQDTYEVQIIKPDGQKKKYPLPPVTKNGISVSVDSVSREFIFVRAGSDSPHLQKTFWITRVGGAMNMASNMILQDSLRLRIPVKDFPMGIAQISVFDSIGTLKAERLVFVNEHKQAHMKIHPDKNNYKTGEETNISIQVADEVDIPIPMECSLSVLPEYRLYLKTTPHILSTFFLTSELKQKIINPNSYFEETSLSGGAIDLLLMTQSIRCFSWDKVLRLDENVHVMIERNFDEQTNLLFTANRNEQFSNAIELDRYKYSQNWYEDTLLTQAIYIDERFSKSKKVEPKFEKVPPWKRYITNVGVLGAINMIKPYQIINGRIVFQGISSFKITTGALIVVDGMKSGHDPRVLGYINPHDVENIQIHTASHEILKFSSFAADGVIEISTKGSGREREISDKKIQQQTMKNPFWMPGLSLDESGKIDFSYYNPKQQMPIIGIIEGINEEGKIVSGSFQYSIR